MATWTISYMMEGAVDVEADSYEEALEAFEDLSDHTLKANTFGCGWEVSDVQEH